MNFSELKTKKGRVAFIREKLSTDERWCYRGLIRIFENQTEDEKRAEDVKHNNGIGFTPADSFFLSSLAKQLMKSRTLTDKQKTFMFKLMPKYAGQLERFSN